MEKDNKKSSAQSTEAKPDKEEKAVKPAAKPAKGGTVVTEVKAAAKFIRISPRKVRLVINQLSGLEAETALDRLNFVNKSAVRPIVKLIKSAVANAENNFQLDKKDLYIKKIVANDGPILKRWKPRAHGRATAIRKRTSHIDLILGVRPGAKKKAVTKKEVKPEEVKVVKPEEIKKEAAKSAGKGPEEKGKGEKGFFKGMFRRKTG